MPISCCAASLDRFFSCRAARYFRQFRRKGLAKEQRLLAAAIAASAAGGESILEVGCGIGALHLSLLQSGASTAVGIDASTGMIDRARALSREMGFSARTGYHVGDFARMTGTLVSPADIVIMDKVFCCYDDPGLLLESAVAKARSLIALSIPRDTLLVRAMFASMIAFASLFRRPFRPYWHDWSELGDRFRTSNFQPVSASSTLLWQMSVYRRIPAAAR